VAMQFAYQYYEHCDRMVLVSSGGLGREISVALRAATLPGAELVLPVIASRHVREAGVAVSRNAVFVVKPRKITHGSWTSTSASAVRSWVCGTGLGLKWPAHPGQDLRPPRATWSRTVESQMLVTLCSFSGPARIRRAAASSARPSPAAASHRDNGFSGSSTDAGNVRGPCGGTAKATS
jgi:hypothetical protein